MGQIADWWIPILPGTDGALALAMCKIIVEENRYDVEFVRNWTQGFEEFAAYLSTLEFEKLSTICGVPVADIRKLTDEFCSTQKASLVSYTGLEYALSAVQNIRAQYVLWAITGKLDVEGGIYLNAWGQPTQPVRPVPEENTPLGAAKYPLYFGIAGMALFGQFPHAVLDDDPYPVRGLLAVGGSPAVSFPDSNTWRAAYERLECLIVVDRFYSEEMRYADVVLPAKTLYEMIRVQPTPRARAHRSRYRNHRPSTRRIDNLRPASRPPWLRRQIPRNEDELRSCLLPRNAHSWRRSKQQRRRHARTKSMQPANFARTASLASPRRRASLKFARPRLSNLATRPIRVSKMCATCQVSAPMSGRCL